jgi:hypothetical protein
VIRHTALLSFLIYPFDFSASVRVPAHGVHGTAEFCRGFETGGGRKLAGGINHLPESEVEDFIGKFDACFGKR